MKSRRSSVTCQFRGASSSTGWTIAIRTDPKQATFINPDLRKTNPEPLSRGLRNVCRHPCGASIELVRRSALRFGRRTLVRGRSLHPSPTCRRVGRKVQICVLARFPERPAQGRKHQSKRCRVAARICKPLFPAHPRGAPRFGAGCVPPDA